MSDMIKANDNFTELPITYVIFITENDVIGKNRLIYRFDRTDEETGCKLDDGTHIIFVNGAYNNADDSSELAKLVHDFLCNDPDKMYIPQFAEKARFFKETRKGELNMCRLMEERIDRVKKETNRDASIQFARRLIAKGKTTYEEIAEYSGLTLEEVKKLAAGGSLDI